MQEQKSATVTMAYPPRPASPTLTNPDMILPYGLEPYGAYDRETPNPSQYPEKLAPGQWDNSPNMAGFASYGQGMQAQMMPLAIGGPVTPIIYGNGTMLSDIGEVTEAESVHGSAKKPTKQELRRSRDSVIHNPRGADMAINVSPTKSYGAVMKRSKTGTHERKVSVESTSTVQSEGHKAEVIEGDFDDGISVDDSVFQGDDEESNVDEGYLQELRNRHGVVTIEDTDDEDPLSSAALSRRAERILANAKRRLDNMEGNLNRARTVYTSPTSSISSQSMPTSPLQHEYQQSTEDRRVHAITTHQGSPGHTRVFSETSIPSPEGPQYPLLASRSMSAMANPSSRLANSSPVGASRDLRVEPRNFARPLVSSPLKRDPPLSPLRRLQEDAATMNTEPGLTRARSSSSALPARITSDDGGVTRSASSLQMRDLHGQMQDLKGKIAQLRDKARADSLRRRSMQSLRASSPFTVAEQWYTSDSSYKDGHLKADAGIAYSPVSQELSGSPNEDEVPLYKVPEEARVGSERSSGSVKVFRKSPPPAPIPEEQHSRESDQTSTQFSDGEDAYDTAAEDGAPLSPDGEVGDEGVEDEQEYPDIDDGEAEGEDEYDDGFVNVDELSDYESESGATEYHDSHAQQLSHEDREDAFDYEHFILHSAMGHISQLGYGRRDSFSSEDSVETTKAVDPADNETAITTPRASMAPRASMGHLRQDSVSTISTVATFATANEGYDDDEEEEEEEQDEQEDAQEDGQEDEQEDEQEVLEEKQEVIEEKQEATQQYPIKLSNLKAPVTCTPMAQKRGTFGGSSPEFSDNGAAANSSAIVEEDSDGSASGGSRPPSVLRVGNSNCSATSASISSGSDGRPSTSRTTDYVPRSDFKTAHRPSISSFNSTGTARSFPLINKPKIITTSEPRSENGSARAGRNRSATVVHTSSIPSSEGFRFNGSEYRSPTIELQSSSARSSPIKTNAELDAMTGNGSGGRPRGMSALDVKRIIGKDGKESPISSLQKEDQVLVENLVASLGKCVLGLQDAGTNSYEGRVWRRRLFAARRVLEGEEGSM